MRLGGTEQFQGIGRLRRDSRVAQQIDVTVHAGRFTTKATKNTKRPTFLVRFVPLVAHFDSHSLAGLTCLVFCFLTIE